MHQISRKLVSVSATSVRVTDNRGEKVVLKKIPYIHYPVQFEEDQGQEGQKLVRVLLDSGSKINAMSPAYAKRLGLKTRKTRVGAQKIGGSALETFGMVIADFQMEDKDGRSRFFQETFLIADTKFEGIPKILFLKLSNANVFFSEETLTWKSYTTNKALPTTEWVKLVDPKEFVIAVLDADSETFVMHVAIQEREEMAMDPDKKA